jgi:4,5-DOPA dioxygenase extradiol
MASFPSIFVSHGAPDLLLTASPALEFFQQLGAQLGQPKAILVISAHWTTPVPTVSLATQPETIHDFWGFPAPLYELTYPAPGAPELADRVSKQLIEAGMICELAADRGLDHGAWEPLMAMYPDAKIPVTQLSVQPHLGPAHHVQMGRALAALRQEGVLVLASGAITHNLSKFRGHAFDAQPPTWVTQFDDWLAETITASELTASSLDRLLEYRRLAPYAVENHPTEEHFLPLFVAIGAGGLNPQGQRLHSSFTYGILSMAAYAFNEAMTIPVVFKTK